MDSTFAPLFDKTPLALERLRLVWPDLTALERATVTAKLLADSSKEAQGLRWTHHRSFVMDLALDDESPYVRYAAAKEVSPPYKDDEQAAEKQTRFDKVAADPSLLVRFAGKESDWSYLAPRELDQPELFWSMPQVQRLILVSQLKRSGESIAALLLFAAKGPLLAGSVTEEEMMDVLLQYLGGKSIAERVAESEAYARRFMDGYEEFAAGESVKALWAAIPGIPKSLAWILIECLPASAGFESDFAGKVVDALDEGLLSGLLYRDDVPLKSLRRKLFDESANRHLRDAAMSSFQFELVDSDITPLVYSISEEEASAKEKVDKAAHLAETCRGASLAQIEALCYLVLQAPTAFHAGLGKWDAVGFGRMIQSQRAKRLPRTSLEREILEMRVFALAKALAPVDGRPLSNLSGPLLKATVPGNPWQTYLNLKASRDLHKLAAQLPAVAIEDFQIPKEIQPDNEERVLDDPDDESPPVFDLLSDVQARVKDISDKDRAELSALGRALTQLAEQAQNFEATAARKIAELNARADKTASTAKLLVWISAATLIFVIFKGH